MKGSYVLLLRVKRNAELRVGKLGKVRFNKGFYAYVGSAMNSLEKRIARHMRKRKSVFWHIDYLLGCGDVEIDSVFIKESNVKEECIVASKLAEKFRAIKNFGCSDCRCGSHLFIVSDKKMLERLLRESGFRRRLW